MSVYILVDVTVHDPALYAEYKRLAEASIAAFGGRYLVRGGASIVLEGNWFPSRLIVLEFESPERAQSWWDSAEYATAKSIRSQCAEGNFILVEGLSA